MSEAQEAANDRSIAMEIARALGRRIVSGDLAPGEWLRQDHIATEFRASHVPVREAFRRLQAQQLVVIEPRRGVRVAALNPVDVIEVAEMRASLEALALRHAMARITERALAAIEAALNDAPHSPIGLAALEEGNRRFHAALVAPCEMSRLKAAIADLHQASARHLFATWRDLDWQARSDNEHRAILAAVKARQVAQACTLLSNHILDAGKALAAVWLRDG
jgi:DNA-binding GntR family transcriptional regulator